MTNATQTLQDRPLVTFALFAYNQEKYIREAVEGAFSQTYEPLEIILSDDCSSDRTHAIISDMANKYNGKKKIIVNKTNINCGTLLHLNDVANIAEGKLIILAAGDDISKPERTEILVNAWKNTGAWALSSKFDRIDHSSHTIARNQIPLVQSSSEYPLRKYFANQTSGIRIVHGATSAYDKRVFCFLDLNKEDYILSEDGAMTVLLNLLGEKIFYVANSLVCYRESEDSLTNATKPQTFSLQKTRNDELSIRRLNVSQANRCEFFLRLNEKYGTNAQIKLDSALISSELTKHRMHARWWSSSLIDKIEYLWRTHSKADLTWCLPRMLPNEIFLMSKTIFKYVIFRISSIVYKITLSRRNGA